MATSGLRLVKNSLAGMLPLLYRYFCVTLQLHICTTAAAQLHRTIAVLLLLLSVRYCERMLQL
jgi:hypothetical protein